MLVHLSQVASGGNDGIVAIDEPETSLHPYAIRRLVEHSRQWAKRHNLKVILTTHSPVLLDGVHAEPNRVFVLERGYHTLPSAPRHHARPGLAFELHARRALCGANSRPTRGLMLIRLVVTGDLERSALGLDHEGLCGAMSPHMTINVAHKLNELDDYAVARPRQPGIARQLP